MALKTRATGFSRFLFVLLFMLAIFFGVQYVLTSTEFGQKLHQDLQEQVEKGSDVDN